jgi:SulP family sulfate permease
MMLMAMGFFRLGKFIEFIPHPVTTGFTAGIGTVIATMQLKDLLGLQLKKTPEHFLERLAAMFEARSTASGYELGIGLVTLMALVLVPRITKLVPPAVVALPLGAGLALLLERSVPNLEVATIARRFHSLVNGQVMGGIPRSPPLPFLPWHLPGPGGQSLDLSISTLRMLLPGAFAIAMLGAIESLLSAVVSDGMARTRHDPDAELLALGVGNILCPFFGGIPATGAIARTATGIRSGSRSPIAAMSHAVFVLIAVLALAPLVGYLPMASLAAVLVLVAWNMADARLFAHIIKVAPRSDVAVLLTCFTLTVAFDMVIAVTVGIVLAAMLFMKRMSEITEAKLTEEHHPEVSGPLPKGVLIYEIAGPLFFGAAERAMNAMRSAVGNRARVMILSLAQVPVLDATGLVALETAVSRLNSTGCLAVISGLQQRTKDVVTRGLPEVPGKLIIRNNLAEALDAARAHVAQTRTVSVQMTPVA